MSAQELLDWQLLKAWAESKPAGSELGETCTNSKCPIANYLYEMTGKLWSVGPSIRPMDGTKHTGLDKPAWVDQLITLVDKISTSSESVPVTREQFLKCLEEVKPCRD
jgi:hypothetical protein